MILEKDLMFDFEEKKYEDMKICSPFATLSDYFVKNGRIELCNNQSKFEMEGKLLLLRVSQKKSFLFNNFSK